MTFHRKIRTADAIRLQHDLTLHTSDGDVTAHAGDWLITEGDAQRVLTDEQFRAEWEQDYPLIPWPQAPTYIYPHLTVSPPVWPSSTFIGSGSTCSAPMLLSSLHFG